MADWEDWASALIVGAMVKEAISNAFKKKKSQDEQEYRQGFSCNFDDGITEDEFEAIVRKAAKKSNGYQ